MRRSPPLPKLPPAAKEDSSDDDSSSDDDAEEAPPAAAAVAAAAKKSSSSDDDSSDDEEEAPAEKAPEPAKEEPAEPAWKKKFNDKKEGGGGNDRSPRGGFNKGERKPFEPRNAHLKGTSNRVFLKNLSYDIDDDGIKEFFKEIGTLTDIFWLTDRESGDFKGAGFLTLESAEAATKAVETLQSKQLLGRPVLLDWAENRKGGSGPRKKGRTPDWVNNPLSEKPDGCTNCFLGNLSFDIDEDVVRAFFKDCGEIESVRWLEKDGEFKGAGFISFSETGATDKATAKNGQEIMGRACRVDYAKGRTNAGGRGGGQRKERLPDWDCPACGTTGNFGSRATCFKCGEKNPAWKGEVPQDWPCACGASNFPSRSSCYKCGEAKPF